MKYSRINNVRGYSNIVSIIRVLHDILVYVCGFFCVARSDSEVPPAVLKGGGNLDLHISDTQ